MDKINFQNLPSTTTPVNADKLNDLQDNVEDAISDINSGLTTIISTPLEPTTGVTTGSTLVQTTIAEAGTYLFVAVIPMNYYGQTGRDLYCRLLVNNLIKASCGGVINASAYGVYSPLITVTEIPANSTVKIIIMDATGKTYACPAFDFHYIKLK